MQQSMATVRGAASPQIFLQHITLSSYQAAREWQATQPVLVNALIVPISMNRNVSSAIAFAVISGPFANQSDAIAFRQKKGVPADTRLREPASLINALPREKAPRGNNGR